MLGNMMSQKAGVDVRASRDVSGAPRASGSGAVIGSAKWLRRKWVMRTERGPPSTLAEVDKGAAAGVGGGAATCTDSGGNAVGAISGGSDAEGGGVGESRTGRASGGGVGHTTVISGMVTSSATCMQR